MSADPTEHIRRAQIADQNQVQVTRESLEAQYGTVFDTDQLCEHFEVLGFLAPYVVVRRKSDGVKGSLMFTHRPRFYFGFDVADGK